MISAPDLDRKLAATEGKVKSRSIRDGLIPDHMLALGERTYLYFAVTVLKDSGLLELPR